GREGFDVFSLPVESLRAVSRVRLSSDNSFAAGHERLDGDAGGCCQTNFFLFNIIKGLKRFETCEKWFILRVDLVFHFNGGAYVDAGQICDENFAAGITFGRSVPACIHDIDFVGGDFLLLAGFGSDDGADELHLFASGIKAELEFGFGFLAAVSEDLLDI